MKTVKNLDREIQPRYYLKAHVQDRDHPEWECTSSIEIFLEDVNDNVPQFTQPIFTVAVAEDVPVGSLISKIHAVDKDLGNEWTFFNYLFSYVYLKLYFIVNNVKIESLLGVQFYFSFKIN